MIQPDDDQTYTERLVSMQPLIVRRRVLFGECDPAQAVYSPRFADYLISAYEWFSRTIIQAGKPLLRELGLATPLKSLQLEFVHVLRPEELFEMVITIQDVRRRTFDLGISGRSLDGAPRFSGTVSPIFVQRDDFVSVAIPDLILERLTAYTTTQDRS